MDPIGIYNDLYGLYMDLEAVHSTPSLVSMQDESRDDLGTD